MRRQKSGHIITVSSLGGFMGVPGSGLFNAAKFASEGLSEALAKEVEPLGIKVTIVEPGGFRTEAGRPLAQASRHIEDYAPTSGKTIQWIKEYANKAPGDPAKAAVAMMKAVASDSLPLRLVLGADALQMVEEKLRTMTEEISAWRAVSVSTDFDEGGQFSSNSDQGDGPWHVLRTLSTKAASFSAPLLFAISAMGDPLGNVCPRRIRPRRLPTASP